MEKILTESQISPKNSFEKFYQLIEKLKLENLSLEIKESLNFLEKSILLSERTIQDINELKLSKSKLDHINAILNRFLDEFCDFISIPHILDTLIINSISYNMLGAVSILMSAKNLDDELFDLYFAKISINKESLALIRTHSIVLNKTILPTKLANIFLNYQNTFNQFGINRKLEFNENEITLLFNKEITNLKNRFLKNDLRLVNYVKLYEESIENLSLIIQKTSNIDFINSVLELSKDEYYVWKMCIKANNKTYSAKKMGYLIFSLSAAIESIDNIKIEIVDWGKGSLWCEFRIIIKDKVAKIDFIELLKKLRRGLESILHKKTIGEIKKLEADAEHLIRQNEVELKANRLEEEEKLKIIEKKLELEIKKEDLISKRIENIYKLSKIMEDGILENDGDLQIFLNNCLYVNLENEQINNSLASSMGEIEGSELKENDDINKN